LPLLIHHEHKADISRVLSRQRLRWNLELLAGCGGWQNGQDEPSPWWGGITSPIEAIYAGAREVFVSIAEEQAGRSELSELCAFFVHFGQLGVYVD